jgi:ankyrin repeat protein
MKKFWIFLCMLCVFSGMIGYATTADAVSLIEASKKGDLAKVQEFINTQAEVNAKDTDGMTALMWASGNGHDEVAKALIAAGADVNAKTKNGVTALMVASKKGHVEIVKLLRAAGAK